LVVIVFYMLKMWTFGFSLCSGIVRNFASVYMFSTSSSRVLGIVMEAKMIGE
jgi:hypothetical protein